MRAVAFRESGDPDVLEVVDLPDPTPGAGEIRVRVRAATVNPTDTIWRAGLRRPPEGWEPPWVVGMELAGTVDAVGPDVDWAVGDRVFAIAVPFRRGGGAQAELVVVPAAGAARTPEGASDAEAATLPMNGLTVLQALAKLDLPTGATLGVTGAAGSVGGYAIELGRVAGLRVVAEASERDRVLVERLGADTVITRSDDPAAAFRSVEPDGVDGLIDAAVIGEPVLGAVRDGGAVASVRGWSGEFDRDITVRSVAVADDAENRAGLDELARLAAHGRLSMRVAATFSADRAAEAHRRLEAGGIRGRLVLTFR